MFGIAKHRLASEVRCLIGDLCHTPIQVLVVHELLPIELQKLTVSHDIFVIYPGLASVPVYQVQGQLGSKVEGFVQDDDTVFSLLFNR